MVDRQLNVKHLAELARINLTEEEAVRFRDQISIILGYVEQLQAIDTLGMEETAQVTGLVNVLRDDQQETINKKRSTEELEKRREELLAAVPEVEQAMVKVPSIL